MTVTLTTAGGTVVGLGRRPAPAARGPLDLLGEDLLLLHGELSADRVVVEGPGAPGCHHVEAGHIAAGGAPVAGGHGPGP